MSAVTATCAGACGGAEIVDPTPEAPSATGSVRVERQGDRLALDILVQELAPPGEVKSGATAFVVWAKPARGGAAQNLGALALDDGEGALRTAIAAEDTSLIVTAEPSAHTGSPNDRPLLWAYVDVAEPDAAEPAPAVGPKEPPGGASDAEAVRPAPPPACPP